MTPAPGELYSVATGDGDYAIVKVLVVEPRGVHLRMYANRFRERPSAVDSSALTLGTVHDQQFGIGHMPIGHEGFRRWEPVKLAREDVTDDELDGYRMWAEHDAEVTAEPERGGILGFLRRRR